LIFLASYCKCGNLKRIGRKHWFDIEMTGAEKTRINTFHFNFTLKNILIYNVLVREYIYISLHKMAIFLTHSVVNPVF